MKWPMVRSHHRSLAFLTLIALNALSIAPVNRRVRSKKQEKKDQETDDVLSLTLWGFGLLLHIQRYSVSEMIVKI